MDSKEKLHSTLTFFADTDGNMRVLAREVLRLDTVRCDFLASAIELT